jgi:hypothetical protein
LKNTVIVNLPNLYVTPEDVIFNAPSSTNPWPNLFSFIDGDFSITDMAINIVGEDLTTGWTIFGIDPPIEELANIIMISGTTANVRAEKLLLQGESMNGSLLGYNVINGIYYEGNIGEFPPPMSGTFQIYNSIIRRVGSGTPVFNLSNATVTISHNNYEDVYLGVDGSDFAFSSLEFSYNSVKAVVGMDLYNFLTTEDVGSNFLIKNNVFRGAVGPAFEQTFGTGISCLIIGNNVANVTDLGIYLGPGTTGCTVIGGSNNTNVLDLGVNNILVGVNNMGTGVGPDIQSIRNLFK